MSKKIKKLKKKSNVEERSVSKENISILKKKKPSSNTFQNTLNLKLKKLFSRFDYNYLLFFFVLIGVFVRFFNLGWDSGNNYHPDEGNIVDAALKIDFPDELEPSFYAYNGFAIYSVRLVIEAITEITGNQLWLIDREKYSLILRIFSASSSVISIFLIYLIILKLTRRKSFATLGLILAELNVGFIQYAHFGVTESMLVMFGLLIAYFSILIINSNQAKYWFVLALVSGLSVATKTSALSYILIPFITWLIVMSRKPSLRTIRLGIFYAVISFMTFFTLSPYSLLNYNTRFKETMDYEGQIVAGTREVPYTLQFNGESSFGYFLWNLVWHMGPFMALAGIVALIFFALLLIYILIKPKAGSAKRRGWEFLDTIRFDIQLLPTIAFALSYILVVGDWFAQFIRYTIPLQPFLIILAVYFLYIIWDRSKKRYLYLAPIVFAVVGFSLIYAFAFSGIYFRQSTRTEASIWMYENFKDGDRILAEHWDYFLPANLKGQLRPGIEFGVINNFDPDSDEKLQEVARTLASGDYLVLASRRLSGNIPKNRIKYPEIHSYYLKLFRGDFGYTEIKRFESKPGFLGINFDTDKAEETFQVFDHPNVIIFKNEANLSEEEILNILRN